MSIDTVGSWQRGITLVELIVFIVIVSVGVAGLVSVIGPMVRTSADPMVTKQLTAIAESILNEAMHQPYTWCDPDDPKLTPEGQPIAQRALSYGDCTPGFSQNTLGAVPSTEMPRAIAPAAGYDNVADYGSFSMNDISDAAGNYVMTGYNVVTVVAQVGTAMGLADNTAALSVTVTVSRNSQSFALTGYRFRYAPRI
jgi:MSHA pilin protein MshD